MSLQLFSLCGVDVVAIPWRAKCHAGVQPVEGGLERLIMPPRWRRPGWAKDVTRVSALALSLAEFQAVWSAVRPPSSRRIRSRACCMAWAPRLCVACIVRWLHVLQRGLSTDLVSVSVQILTLWVRPDLGQLSEHGSGLPTRSCFLSFAPTDPARPVQRSNMLAIDFSHVIYTPCTACAGGAGQTAEAPGPAAAAHRSAGSAAAQRWPAPVVQRQVRPRTPVVLCTAAVQRP